METNFFRLTKFTQGKPYEDVKGLYTEQSKANDAAIKILTGEPDMNAVVVFDLFGDVVKVHKRENA